MTENNKLNECIPDYSCVGAYLDLEGLGLVRFDVVNREFIILKTEACTDYLSYREIVDRINSISNVRLTERKPGHIEVMCNFSKELKALFIKDARQRQESRSIRNTYETQGQRQNIIDRLLTLQHLRAADRLSVPESEISLYKLIEEVKRMDRRELESNPTAVPLALQSVLLSVCWFEEWIMKNPNLYGKPKQKQLTNGFVDMETLKHYH